MTRNKSLIALLLLSLGSLAAYGDDHRVPPGRKGNPATGIAKPKVVKKAVLKGGGDVVKGCLSDKNPDCAPEIAVVPADRQYPREAGCSYYLAVQGDQRVGFDFVEVDAVDRTQAHRYVKACRDGDSERASISQLSREGFLLSKLAIQRCQTYVEHDGVGHMSCDGERLQIAD